MRSAKVRWELCVFSKCGGVAASRTDGVGVRLENSRNPCEEICLRLDCVTTSNVSSNLWRCLHQRFPIHFTTVGVRPRSIRSSVLAINSGHLRGGRAPHSCLRKRV
eukprot:scaffold2868_cov348-Pavlova_lutheri.AAC.24